MYQLAAPHPDLHSFIEHYWTVFASPEEELDLTVDVYVDARADLVFNFGAPYSRAVIGRHPVTYTTSNLDAQRSVPIRIVQRGQVFITGVRFRTGGLSPFIRGSLAPFTNRTPGIAEVLGEEALTLEAALSASRTDVDAQRRLLDTFFLDRREASEAQTLFFEVKTRIENDGGLKPVEEICRDASVVPRSLTRLFARYLGLSPKYFARIVRFQKALRILMTDTTTTIGTVSAECGYFDQPHFVRDFRRFTGGVPRGYRGYYPPAVPLDFAPNVVRFIQDRRRR